MSVNGALSVKERLALLQDSNAGKNKELVGPMKTTIRPSTATKPEISTTQPKPVLPTLKPVKPPATNSGGAANQDSSDAIPKWRRKDITPVKSLASDTDVTSSTTPLSPSEDPVHDKSTARLSIKERLEALNKSSGGKDGLPPMSPVNSSQKAVFPKPQQNESLTSPVSPKGDNAESRSSKWPPVPTKKIGEHHVNVPPHSVPKEDSAESASSLLPTSKKSENEEQQAIRGGHTNLPDRGLKPLKPPPGKLKVSFTQNENDKAEDSKGGSTNFPKPLKLPGVKPIINGTVGAELTKVQLRKTSGARQSSELIVRHTDGKKFRKIDSALPKISLPAPKKPQRLDNINLTNFIQEYQEEVEKMKKDLMSEQTGEEEMDEVYDDAQSTDVVIRKSEGTARQGPARISAIPEFTEEEEEHEFYDDCSSKPAEPEENYDDFSEQGPQEEYEAVDEINKPMSPPPSDSKQMKKEKKEKEKDNEMQQNKEKATIKDNLSKKEKEQKKKEEEKKKIMAKFGVKDVDQKIGDGVVVKDSGGGAFKKDQLAVSKGEIVTILNMTNTPVGKWLVQNANGKIGLVQASNIEVATPTIRSVLESISASTAKSTELSMMSGCKEEKSSTKKLPEADDNEPGEVYEALPEEEGEIDDIYEEL